MNESPPSRRRRLDDGPSIPARGANSCGDSHTSVSAGTVRSLNPPDRPRILRPRAESRISGGPADLTGLGMLHLPGHGRGGRLGPSPRAESRISGRPADLHSVGMTTPRHPGHRGEVAGPIPQRRGWATSRVRLPSTMAPMPQPGDPYASAFIAEVN